MSLFEQIAQAEKLATGRQPIDPAFNWSDMAFLSYWIDLGAAGHQPYHGMTATQVVMTATLKRALNLTAAQSRMTAVYKREPIVTFRGILRGLTADETPLNVGESRRYPIPDAFKTAWSDVQAAIHEYLNAADTQS